MQAELSVRRPWRDSVVVKVIGVALLILVLLIPLGMVGSLIGERQERQKSVADELAAVWGQPQTIGGPVIALPFKSWIRGSDGQLVERNDVLQILPETLVIDGVVKPERRSRGIFSTILYRTELRVRGTFRTPRSLDLGVDPAYVLWDRPELSVGVTDLRGIAGPTSLAWQGQSLPFEPGAGRTELWTSGLHATMPAAAMEGPAAKLLSFSFTLDLAGSQSLKVLPFGKVTDLALRSTWANPSFSGGFLPKSRQLGPDGFRARWSVAYFGRGYPQVLFARAQNSFCAEIEKSAFGVDFKEGVDSYQMTERSVKYGVLFLALTFATFFLFELFHPLAVHPLQYLLVGAALCLFYLLLLSISEQTSFQAAYAIAAGATVALLGGYSSAVLRGKGRAAIFSGVLGLLYGYLYVLLQSEDYALLLGSIGLFLILALVMLITRRVDWYQKGQTQKAAAAVS